MIHSFITSLHKPSQHDKGGGSIVVYFFTGGQLSDTMANAFITHMAIGLFATVWTS